MIVDDAEDFLKFLNNVGLQLACLLDIDGTQKRSTSKRSNARQKLAQVSTKGVKGDSRSKHSTNSLSGKKHQQRQTKLQQQTRAKGGRRKNNRSDELEGLLENSSISMNNNSSVNHHVQNISQQVDSHQVHHQHHLLHQYQQQQQQQQQLHQQLQLHELHPNQDSNSLAQSKQQLHQLSVATSQPESSLQHSLDRQLTLSMTDELPIDHGASISPVTHLSPLDSTVHFNAIHPQHYYTPHRSHVDSYHLHDEFSSHEQIPITSSTSPQQLSQEQQRMNIHITNHQHQSTSIRNESSPLDVVPIDCYRLQHGDSSHLSQHQHHQHHHQNHNTQQQHQHQHHQVQYHQLDQQWLGTASHIQDSSLQLTSSDPDALEHVVPLSPVTHTSLEQTQFNPSLYHHGYYGHQAEHLDSFQHMGDDYITNSVTLTSISTPTSTNHMQDGRLQPSTQQQRQAQQQSLTAQLHQHQQSLPRLVTVSSNSSSNNTTSYTDHQQHHHLTQQQQHSHHHQQQHTQNQVQHSQANEHHNIQSGNVNPIYSSHHESHPQLIDIHQQHSQHQHHHHIHQHQMMPLINGLEPSGVIIQDINLASASWSSPEDLYSI